MTDKDPNYPSFPFIEEKARTFGIEKQKEIETFPDDIVQLVLEGSFCVPFSQMQFYDPKLIDYTNAQLRTIFEYLFDGKQKITSNNKIDIEKFNQKPKIPFTIEEQVMILTFLRLFPNADPKNILNEFGDYFVPCRSLNEIVLKTEQMKSLTDEEKEKILDQYAHDITDESLFGLSTLTEPTQELVNVQLRPSDFLQCRCTYHPHEEMSIDVDKLETEIVPLLDISPHLWADEMTEHDLAILRSDTMKWYMRREAILIGRGSIDFDVDVDLSNFGEKACVHISRHQAILSFLMDYNFYIQNIGNRIFRVNGAPIYPGQMGRLPENAILDFSGILMIFYPNKQLIADLKESVTIGPIRIPDEHQLGERK